MICHAVKQTKEGNKKPKMSLTKIFYNVKKIKKSNGKKKK